MGAHRYWRRCTGLSPRYTHTHTHTHSDTHTHFSHIPLLGLLNLLPTDESTGGFACVPGSHKLLPDVLQLVDRKQRHKTYHPLDPCKIDPLVSACGGWRRVHASAGAVVLWKSSLIHSNVRNQAGVVAETKFPLLRAVVYVTIMPTPAGEDAAPARREKLQQGVLCNHWPIGRYMRAERLVYPRHPSFKKLRSVALPLETVQADYSALL